MATEHPIEIKKDGLSQLQDGSWVLKVKIHPEEMNTALMQAPMGTRYAMALVEIGDDEQPVQKPKEKRSFHELPYSQQAAMLCEDMKFHRYLLEATPCLEGADVVKYVRRRCGVNSRRELDSNDEAAARWRNLYSKFKAWEAIG